MAASSRDSGVWLFLRIMHGRQHHPSGSRTSAWMLPVQTTHMPSLWCQCECLATHGQSCRQSEARHSSINDLIYRALLAAKIPSRLEPSWIYRSDGKRPDSITMVPLEHGKLLVWDATSTDTYAPSYTTSATSEAGAVAAMADMRKRAKYSNLDPLHYFQPVAVETSGAFGLDISPFLKKHGHRISRVTGETRSFLFLIQHLG